MSEATQIHYRCANGHSWSMPEINPDPHCPQCGVVGSPHSPIPLHHSTTLEADESGSRTGVRMACPRCSKPLRSNKPVPQGKELHCPDCHCTFQLDANGNPFEITEVTVRLRELRSYQVGNLIGKGSMGEVYRAYDPRLQRTCALKTLKIGDEYEDSVNRFFTEAQAIAALDHPNIIKIFDIGTYKNRPALVLEYCTGGSLESQLQQTKFTFRQSAQLIEALARGMQIAHQANVVHRDLKPANVLLTADQTPKITDFSLAKKLDNLSNTQTGMPMGTPPYMAPEQARGDPHIGPLADVYGLGAMLYCCLTGRPPFEGSSVSVVLSKVLHEEPVPPSQLNPDIPLHLERICLSCLEKEPENRYPSAGALAEDLQRYLQGALDTLRPASTVRPVSRRKRPFSHLTITSLAAVILLLAGAGWLYWLREGLIEASTTLQATRQAEILLRVPPLISQVVNDAKALPGNEKITSMDWKPSEPGQKREPRTIPFPFTFTHQLLHNLEFDSDGSERNDGWYFIYSEYPFRKREMRLEEADRAKVRQALEQFGESTSNKPEVTRGVFRNMEVVFAFAPIRMNESCLTCHNRADSPSSGKVEWKVGDARAVLAVALPLDKTRDLVTSRLLKMLALIGGVLGLIVLGSWRLLPHR